MKTTYDAVDIVIGDLLNSSLKTAISGIVCKQRPLDSTKEDVVVNSLPTINGDVQQGIINVNIHVPNVTIDFSGKQDSTQPDSVRLKELSDMAVAILDNSWGANYNYSVQQQNNIPDQNNYYCNIRVLFVWVNIN